MKAKHIINLILLILISIQLHSQVDVFQQGTIVLNNGDSISCSIDVYSANVFYYKRKIKYKIEEEKSKIESSKVKEVILTKMYPDSVYATKMVSRGPRKVKVTYKKVEYKYQESPESIYYSKFSHKYENLNNDEDSEPFIDNFFAALVLEGKHDLYKRYTFKSGGSQYASYIETTYYLMTDKGLTKIKKYKKDLPDIYQNCPKLIEKIEQKEFKKMSIEEIIAIANELCQDNE